MYNKTEDPEIRRLKEQIERTQKKLAEVQQKHNFKQQENLKRREQLMLKQRSEMEKLQQTQTRMQNAFDDAWMREEKYLKEQEKTESDLVTRLTQQLQHKENEKMHKEQVAARNKAANDNHKGPHNDNFAAPQRRSSGLW